MVIDTDVLVPGAADAETILLSEVSAVSVETGRIRAAARTASGPGRSEACSYEHFASPPVLAALTRISVDSLFIRLVKCSRVIAGLIASAASSAVRASS